jgi:class 3 adenylate cyclase
LKREIERLEGTLEKFIGDAVMPVFGGPLAMKTMPNERCGRRSGHRSDLRTQ